MPPLPRIVKNPGVKSVPILKKKGYKKAGAKYGPSVYVKPKPKAPATPAAPAGPYDAYPDWAKRQLTQLDNDAKFHQVYVADKIIPQASAGLANLAQYATTANDQYLAQLKGASQGAYNVAAGSSPMSVSGGPGGIVASPNAYQTQASSELGRSLGSAAVAIGEHSAMLGKTSPAIMGQGIVANLAEYAKGLPLTYTTRRDEKMAEIDQFLQEMAVETAKFEETQRHNRVQESISATNAESNAAIAFGRLGLDASKEGYDQTRDTVAGSSPAPYGYQRDPATGDLVRDPSVPQTTDSGSGSGGGTQQGDKYTRSWFLEKGYKQVPAKAGAKWQNNAIASVDGSGKWVKGTGTGARKKPKVTPYGDLVTDLDKKFNGSGDAFSSSPGWAQKFRGNQRGLGQALAGWVIQNAASLTTNGKFDVSKMREILGTLGDGDKKFSLIWPIIKPRIKNGRLV